MKRIWTLALAAFTCFGSFSLLTCCDGGQEKGASSAVYSSGVSLSVVTPYAGEDGNAKNYQAAIADWQRETGNTIEDFSANSSETQKAKILAGFETGSEPDVLLYFIGVDADPFVAGEKVVSINEVRSAYPDFASNMNDNFLRPSPVDGKTYAIPVNSYWEGLYVNRDVLTAADAALPGPNTTWDEFLTICQAVKDAGYTPIAASLGEIPHYWLDFCIYNHGNAATHATLPVSVDDPRGQAFIAGLNDIKQLYDWGYFPKNTLTARDDEAFADFVEGKAAFWLDGSWKVGAIERACGADPSAGIPPDPQKLSNFTVTYFPGQGDRKTTDILSGLSMGYYITRKAYDDPVKREAAVNFVSYMTSNTMVSRFVLASGNLTTALKAGITLPEEPLSSLLEDGLNMVKNATASSENVQDIIPKDARVPLLVPGVADIVTGKTSPEEALEKSLLLTASQMEIFASELKS